jgi:hypothetical protein
LHSAVSPIFNRQTIQTPKRDWLSRLAEFNSAIRQIKNPRYARTAGKARRFEIKLRSHFCNLHVTKIFVLRGKTTV